MSPKRRIFLRLSLRHIQFNGELKVTVDCKARYREPAMSNHRLLYTSFCSLYHLTPAAFPSSFPAASFVHSLFGLPTESSTDDRGPKAALNSHRSNTSLSLRKNNERTKKRKRKGKGTEREKFHTCAPRVKHAAAASAFTVTVTAAVPSLRARDSLGRRGGSVVCRPGRARGRPEFVAAL